MALILIIWEEYHGFRQSQSRSDLLCKWSLSMTYAFARDTGTNLCITPIVFFFTRNIQSDSERLDLGRLLRAILWKRYLMVSVSLYREIAWIPDFSFPPAVRSLFLWVCRACSYNNILFSQTNNGTRVLPRRRHLIARSYLLDKHLLQYINPSLLSRGSGPITKTGVFESRTASLIPRVLGYHWC